MQYKNLLPLSEFYLETFCKLKILNKFPFARNALTYGQRLEMCTCILQLKRHCFTLKGAGRGVEQRLFCLEEEFFFQTEIHLLYSQLISCVPNTNVIIMSSSTSTTSLSPFYDPGLCDVWPVSREVYLQVEGRERDRSMRKRHFDKVR